MLSHAIYTTMQQRGYLLEGAIIATAARHQVQRHGVTIRGIGGLNVGECIVQDKSKSAIEGYATAAHGIGRYLHLEDYRPCIACKKQL